MKKHTTSLTLVVATAGLLAVTMGCSTASSAPFHMYSSPLLEGELEPTPGADRQSEAAETPGVESRQAFAYRKWHSDYTVQPSHPQPRIASTGTGAQEAFDVVEPPSEPVLASSGGQPTGTGAHSGDNGASPDAASRTVEESTAPPAPAPEDSTESPEEASGDTDSGSSAASAGYIHTILELNEVDFDDETETSIPRLYRACRNAGETFHSRSPNIGDLVFFHNTRDENGDGRNNDWYTLVGIVEQVHSDGTVDFLAHRGDGVETLHVNLDRLEEQTASDGQTLNSELRAASSDDPPFTQYLAGQLFAGYCDVLGDRPELVLVDEWSP